VYKIYHASSYNGIKFYPKNKKNEEIFMKQEIKSNKW
jgi:hypothetical protein